MEIEVKIFLRQLLKTCYLTTNSSKMKVKLDFQ